MRGGGNRQCAGGREGRAIEGEPHRGFAFYTHGTGILRRQPLEISHSSYRKRMRFDRLDAGETLPAGVLEFNLGGIQSAGDSRESSTL